MILTPVNIMVNGAPFAAIALAQVDAGSLAVYGPFGIMTAWFMLRFEQFIKESREARTQIVTKFEEHGHKVDGLRLALLASVVSNESAGEKLRQFCQAEIDRVEISTGRRRT